MIKCKNKTDKGCAYLIFSILFAMMIIVPKAEGQTKLDSNLIISIEREVIRKEKRLVKMVRTGEIEHEIIADYELESFRVEEYLNRRVARNNTNANYIQELLLAEKRYQIILSKYLLILQGLLTDEDKLILEKSQGVWHAYRKMEQELNRRLNPEGYDLPAIPIATIAERHLDITKYRVIELVDYISRVMEK